MHTIQPRFETLSQKILVGKSLRVSFVNNRTFELWRSFMPARKTIKNIIGTELYSVEVYQQTFFENFNPATEFEKWAAVEVSVATTLPEGMETLTIPTGLYAIFIHTGPATDGPKTYQYIFGTWLPQSGYQIDARPHFALMGDKYKNDSPDSEEELWIPIKPVV